MKNTSFYKALLLMTMFFIPFYLTGKSGSKHHSINNKLKDTLDKHIRKMIKAKIAYEREYYFADANRVKLKNDYFSMVKHFKKNKMTFVKYIKSKLNDTSPNNIYIQFTYVVPYNSRIPPCTYLTYSGLLNTLLYNLQFVQSDTTLVCRR